MRPPTRHWPRHCLPIPAAHRGLGSPREAQYSVAGPGQRARLHAPATSGSTTVAEDCLAIGRARLTHEGWASTDDTPRAVVSLETRHNLMRRACSSAGMIG